MRRLLRRTIFASGVLILAFLILLASLRLLAWFRESDASIPPSTTLIETSLGAVATTISGRADGSPILLVHGTAAWSGFWRDVAAHLSRQGWRVIAVDIPPFGYSARDPAARYDRVSQAARLSEVLRASTDQPAVVVGHSFGAGAATELTLRSPAQVRSLILVDAALGKLDPVGSGSLVERTLSTAVIAQPLTSATLTNPWTIGPLMRSMVARKDMTDRWITTLRQPMRRPGTTADYATWLPVLFAADDGGWSRRSERLAAIVRPVAIIWGAADTVTPPAQGEHIAALTRARSFTRLPGVGHIPHIEDPAAFFGALDAATAPDRGK
ncbi:MAG: alpha/beta hydrolase [Sphingomonas sp.]|nr:alpha/beta hydrolase [Sphingomonas sp.]MDX3883670.1 alpha/beta hydrolase [Sphingomonas sp.]